MQPETAALSVVLFLVLTGINGAIASKKGYSVGATVLLSVLGTPILVWMYLAAVPPQRRVREASTMPGPKPKSGPVTDDELDAATDEQLVRIEAGEDARLVLRGGA